MPKPLIMPNVTVRRIEGYSLAALRERLAGGSNVVRIGLPDNETTEKGDAVRNARKQQKAPKVTP